MTEGRKPTVPDAGPDRATRLLLFADDPVRAVLPFAVVAFAGALSLLLPPHRDTGTDVQVALAAAAAVVVIGLVLTRLSAGSRLVALPPLAFFVVIAIARDVSGGSTSGLAPLVILPVLWFVLYGTRAQLWMAAVGTATVFFVPLVVAEGELYALSDWRRGVLWFLAVAIVCPPLQRVVQALRSSVQEQSRLAGQLTSVLRAATEQSVIATDLTGTITVFSEGAERMLGYAAGELVGRSTPAPLHDADEVLARAAELGIEPGFDVFVAGVPEDGATTRDWTYLRKDGSRLRVRLTITRVRDDSGEHTGWIGIARDVTAEAQALRDLEVAEERWRALLDHLPDTTVMVVGPRLDYRVAMGAGLRSQRLDDVRGKTLHETSSPENVAVLEPLYRAALAGREGSVELAATQTGASMEVAVVPLPRTGDEPEALVLGRDVSAARRQALELQRSHDRFAMLFDEAPHGTLLTDPSGVVSQVNPALCALLGIPADQVVGVSVRDLPFADNGEPSRLGDLLSGRTAKVVVERTLHGGQPEAVHVVVTAVALREGDQTLGILATVVDVSERKRFEIQLAHLADHDPLTGLANRRRFDRELTAHLDRCARYGPSGALFMLDLDNFKQVNDTLGHGAGDQLIVSTAAVLSRRLRTTDVVARLGGDEFAILLPHADRAAAELVAADIVALVRDEVRVLDGSRPRSVTTSLGVVMIQDVGITASELLSTADMTMYDAKDAGRDGYVVHDTAEFAVPRTAARIAWAERIADAIADDSFVVLAQPVLDLRTGRLTGAELLIRMRDEHSGELVLPNRFLYIAERVGLITDIDLLMVSHGARLLETLQRVAPGFSVEVNLSGHSVGNPRLAQHITNVVQQHDIDPHGLVFEITETAAVSDIETARAFAEQIGALGCRFALDDFGAGFGSFYYLKHLLFDFVKIDGEFVAKAPSNPTDQIILSSIVGIARGLGKETIAEFVADEEILEVVTRLGVDHAQGYHVGRPMPLAELVDLLTSEQAVPRHA